MKYEITDLIIFAYLNYMYCIFIYTQIRKPFRWFYNLRVASCELRVTSCNFMKTNLRVASSFLRVEIILRVWIYFASWKPNYELLIASFKSCFTGWKFKNFIFSEILFTSWMFKMINLRVDGLRWYCLCVGKLSFTS